MKKPARRVRNYRFTILRPGTWSPFIWITVLLRMAGAFSIFWVPLGGMIFSFFMDWFDAYLLIQRARVSREAYHMLDKNLDQVWSVIMLFAAWHSPYFGALVFLFAFRMIGHLWYIAANDTRIFLLFPNVFDFAFFWFVALAPWTDMFSRQYFWPVVVGLTGIKMFQEVALHWIWPARLRYMKTRWHGYSPLLRALGWQRLGM